ncbi:MAG TPA: 50S ribosomal protein L29 [Candidatus Paceibacterota bacterium]
MNAADIRDKSDQELALLLTEKREAARAARFGRSGAASGNVKAAAATRRDIARILTAQNARVRSAAKPTA